VKEDEGEREFSEGSLCAASASSLLVNTGCFSWLAVSLPNQERPHSNLTGVNKYRLHLFLRGGLLMHSCCLSVSDKLILKCLPVQGPTRLKQLLSDTHLTI